MLHDLAKIYFTLQNNLIYTPNMTNDTYNLTR